LILPEGRGKKKKKKETFSSISFPCRRWLALPLNASGSDCTMEGDERGKGEGKKGVDHPGIFR